jgi:Protein of unknown function (DUF3592)
MFDFSAKGWNIRAKGLCGLSVVAMIVAAGIGIYRWSYLQQAIPTRATITNLTERQGSHRTKLFAPVYVFEDQQGKEVKITSSSASRPPVGKIGDQIEVLYLASDPQRSIQNRFFAKWGGVAIWGGLGLFYFIAFGLVAYLTGRRMKDKAKPASVGNT